MTDQRKMDIFKNLCERGFRIETWPISVNNIDYIQLRVSKVSCNHIHTDQYSFVPADGLTDEETGSLIFSLLETLADKADEEIEAIEAKRLSEIGKYVKDVL
jgi:hypothetical protein